MLSIMQIGEHAGIVWRELHDHVEPQTFEELKKATGLDVIQLSAALGCWPGKTSSVFTKMVTR